MVLTEEGQRCNQPTGLMTNVTDCAGCVGNVRVVASSGANQGEFETTSRLYAFRLAECHTPYSTSCVGNVRMVASSGAVQGEFETTIRLYAFRVAE